jgi:hypothetical protein
MLGRWLLGAIVLTLACAANASAGTRVVVGIGGPPAYYYRPHGMVRFYYAPAPVYVTPAPIYVVPAQPPTVYVLPARPAAPVYTAPPPAVDPAAPSLPPPPPAPIPTVPAPGK